MKERKKKNTYLVHSYKKKQRQKRKSEKKNRQNILQHVSLSFDSVHKLKAPETRNASELKHNARIKKRTTKVVESAREKHFKTRKGIPMLRIWLGVLCVYTVYTCIPCKLLSDVYYMRKEFTGKASSTLP